MTVFLLLPYILLLGVFFYFFVYKRSKFKNRRGAGAFFFENDCLVLNTGVPYPIPLDEIARVELHYNQWELDHQLSFSLWVWAVRKSGKVKRVYYKGYGTAKLPYPTDMKTALEEKGLSVVMVNSQDKKKK